MRATMIQIQKEMCVPEGVEVGLLASEGRVATGEDVGGPEVSVP